MKGLRLFVGMSLLATTVGSSAWANKKHEPTWKGTIPVTGQHSDAELQQMAKVTKDDAQKTALAAVKAAETNKKVVGGELEAEHGYLIWSFDIQVTGKTGEQEVLVDAGNGKVLAQMHETPAAEEKEKAETGAKPGK